MNYIVMDLEWNNAYSKTFDSYVCEVFQIGAVKLNSDCDITDQFSEIIKPQILSEFNSRILKLTNVNPNDFENAKTLIEVLADFEEFIGEDASVIMTWSKSDLPVLLENYGYIYPKIKHVPFMTKYMDLQSFVQWVLEIDAGNQISLTNAAEKLGVIYNDLPPHSAINDSIIASRCLKKVFDENTMANFIFKTDKSFYKKLLFKTVYISNLKDKRIFKNDLKFFCPDCKKLLRTKNNWKHKNRSFFNVMKCPKCKGKYKCVFRAKETGDGIQKSKRIVKITENEEVKVD